MTKLWALFAGSLIVGLTALAGLMFHGPAKAQQFGPFYCNQMATAAAGFTTTKVAVVPVPGVASSRIFICGMTASSLLGGTMTFQYGTGTACATGSTAIGPTIQLPAASTYDDGAGVFRGFLVPAGNGFCVTGSTNAANLTIYYGIQ